MEGTEVQIEARRLAPELFADLLGCFDRVAFADHQEWAGCYCTHFHWDAGREALHQQIGQHKRGRDYAVEFLQAGIMQGYLAYVDGEVVGWCNANDRSGYRRLVEAAEVWDDASRTERARAVVCFVVAPAMRGKGIATRLLLRVCEDAAKEGYAYVEAYPCTGETDAYVNHHGPYAMYQQCGLVLRRSLGDAVIVRRYG